MQGCFAAFYSGLEREFDNLWNVLRQLVEAAGRAISELFEAENDLLDIDVSCTCTVHTKIKFHIPSRPNTVHDCVCVCTIL